MILSMPYRPGLNIYATVAMLYGQTWTFLQTVDVVVPADRTGPRTWAAGCREPKRAAPSWSPGSGVSDRREQRQGWGWRWGWGRVQARRPSARMWIPARPRSVTEYLSSAQSSQWVLWGSPFDLCQRRLMANCRAEAHTHTHVGMGRCSTFVYDRPRWLWRVKSLGAPHTHNTRENLKEKKKKKGYLISIRLSGYQIITFWQEGTHWMF